MNCFGTYFTHVQSSNVTRVQSAFFWLLAAWVRVPGRSPFSQPKLPQRTNPIVGTKTFIIHGITKDRINQQIPKQINPPRSSESKPFRSQVIDGAQRRRKIGAEQPWGSRYLWQESAFDRRERSTDDKWYLTNNTTWPNSPVKLVFLAASC